MQKIIIIYPLDRVKIEENIFETKSLKLLKTNNKDGWPKNN